MAAEVAVAMAAEVAATAMSEVVDNGAMLVVTVEEILEAIGATGAKPDIVEIEDVVAMAPTTDIVAAVTTTTSRHTVFKARWFSIF